MIPPKIQLLLIYGTLAFLFITLASLVNIHLIWLALPFSFLLIQSFMTLWLPEEHWLKQTTDNELVLTKTHAQLVVVEKERVKSNSPTFENYQHIKKVLAIHQKRFPNAQVHQHPMIEK